MVTLERVIQESQQHTVHFQKAISEALQEIAIRKSEAADAGLEVFEWPLEPQPQGSLIEIS